VRCGKLRHQFIISDCVFRCCSSDLWVANAIPGAADTGTNASINFAVGTAAGTFYLHVLRLVPELIPILQARL
jgi:hypothetical protein